MAAMLAGRPPLPLASTCRWGPALPSLPMPVRGFDCVIPRLLGGLRAPSHYSLSGRLPYCMFAADIAPSALECVSVCSCIAPRLLGGFHNLG